MAAISAFEGGLVWMGVVSTFEGAVVLLVWMAAISVPDGEFAL